MYAKGIWLRIRNNNEFFVNITVLFGVQERRHGFIT